MFYIYLRKKIILLIALPCSLVQYMVEAADRHVLADHHQVRRGVAAADHRQYVRVREDPTLKLHHAKEELLVSGQDGI